MYLKNVHSLLRTVTFRLTLWYSVVFGMLSLVVFIIVYLSLSWRLNKKVDYELLGKASEFKALYTERGIKALGDEFQREAESQGIRRVFYRLLSSTGDVLVSTDTKHWGDRKALHLGNITGSRKPVVFLTVSFPPHRHKARILFERTDDGRLLELGTRLRYSELMMERYRETFGTALAIMLACGGILGWLLARKAMAGVQRVTDTAAQIREGNLTRRVALGREGEEIVNLAKTFNDMLDRIDALVRELKEVTDNIAHDLRSPITRIRGIAETTLTGKSRLEDFQDATAKIIEESDRLIEMINTMLEITKAEAGVADLSDDRVDMGEILRRAVDLFRFLAEDKNIDMQLLVPREPVFIRGDRARLQRAVANLLDNAIKFTPQGGSVTVSLVVNAEKLTVEVADTGMGISPGEGSLVFERFYRSDKSRSTPGSGLGLSLAQAIIHAHGGDIAVASSPGKGSSFVIKLPRLPLSK